MNYFKNINILIIVFYSFSLFSCEKIENIGPDNKNIIGTYSSNNTKCNGYTKVNSDTIAISPKDVPALTVHISKSKNNIYNNFTIDIPYLDLKRIESSLKDSVLTYNDRKEEETNTQEYRDGYFKTKTTTIVDFNAKVKPQNIEFKYSKKVVTIKYKNKKVIYTKEENNIYKGTAKKITTKIINNKNK